MAQSNQRSKRVSLSPDEKTALLVEFRASGLSARAFCASRSLPYVTFQNWRRKLSPASGIPGTGGFVRLTVGAAPAAHDVEIEFPNGVRVRLGGPVSPPVVCAIVAGASC